MTQQQAERKAHRIPTFVGRKEEAEFWDTHDLMDYWDKCKSVEVKFAEHPSDGIILPHDIFEVGTWRELDEHAQRQGIDPATLLQRWILERLEAERQRASGRGFHVRVLIGACHERTPFPSLVD